MKKPLPLIKVLSDRLLKNSLFLSLDYLLATGIGFLFWLILSRSLNSSEVGIASALVSGVSLVTLFSMFGFDESLVKYLPQSKEFMKIVHTALITVSSLTIAVAFVFVFFADRFSKELSPLKTDILFSAIFIIACVVWVISVLVDSVYLAEGRGESILTKNLIFNVLKLGMLCFLVFVLHYTKFISVIFSWYFAMLIAMSPFIYLLYKKRKGAVFSLGSLKGIFRFSAWSYLINFLIVSHQMLLPLIIINVLGAKEAAYFYIVVNFANLIFMVPWAVNRSLFSQGSHEGTDMRKLLAKSLLIQFLCIIPMVAAMVLMSGLLLSMFGQEYMVNGRTLFIWFAMSAVFFAVIETYRSVMRIRNLVKQLAVFFLAGKGILFLLVFPAMARWGLDGIGIAWFASTFLMSIPAAIRIKREMSY